MSNEPNPYASPATAPERVERTLRTPSWPWGTRLCSIGLVLNLLCIPCFALCEGVSDALRRAGTVPHIVALLEAVCSACGIWVIIAWPVVSLLAALYSAFPDRYTRFWSVKTTIASLMFALWMWGCGFLVFLIATFDEADF